MALTGSSIASTYLKLLRANSDTMGADATASYIQDSADTDSALSISTTRVGIGTAAPAVELDISSAGPQIRLTDTDGGYCEVANVGGKLLLQADKGGTEGSSYIRFDVDGTEYMRLKDTGNVGIGTDSPEGLLEISSSTADRPYVYITNNSTTADDQGGNLVFRTGDPDANLTDNDIIGDVTFKGQDNSDDAYIAAALIRGRIDGTPDTNDMPGELAFYTNSGANSATQKMCIRYDGKVGIGTASPRCLLEGKIAARTTTYAAGTASTWADITLWNPTDTINTATGIRFGIDSADLDDGNNCGAGIAGVKEHATAEYIGLAFITDDASGASEERVRIDAEGNVGIGTDAPVSNLDVTDASGGVLSLSRDDTVVYTGNLFGKIQATGNDNSWSGSTIAGSIQIRADGDNHPVEDTHPKSYMSFLTADGSSAETEQMRIDSSGNVGIGAAPVAKMHISTADASVTPSTSADELLVENAGHAGITIASSTTTTGNLFFADSGDNATGQITYNHSDNYMMFGTGGSEAVRITEDGGIYEKGGALKENLLTNSGFDVWSNSGLTSGDGVGRTTDFNVSNILTDTDGSSYASWTATRCTITDGGANLLITETSANQNLVYALSGLTIGKLYKCSFTCGDGTGAWGDETTRLDIAPNGGGTALATITIDDAGTYSLIWEATEVNNQLYFVITSLASGATLTLDDLYVDEVTPGCVAADDKAMDGWTKSVNTLDIYREHNHATYSKDGSFYSLKAVKGGAGAEYLVNDRDNNTNLERTQRFAGRVITIGAWVYSVSASNNVKLAVYNHSGWTVSSSFAGADAWEWMELTLTVNASVTNLRYGFLFDGNSADVAYISQPMLVFGSSIGEGNYTRPQGEIVDCETNIRIQDNVTPAAADDKVLNLEALSSGKVPKGCKSVQCMVQVINSSITSDQGVSYGQDAAGSGQFRIYPDINNIYKQAQGQVTCDSNGDIYQTVSEAGETLSGLYQDIYSIHLR